MSVQDLIKQSAKTAINRFKTEGGFFLQPSKESGQKYHFDAIFLTVDYTLTDDDGVRTLATGVGFEIDHETFERLYYACDKDFSESFIVQHRDGRRKMWKILAEQPYEELAAGVLYRLNTVEWNEEKG
ncbi:MAG: hypothetical protein LBT05_08435 [Planctomycetaceae bacterium]|jgi:hypothetical protein|nr:hypothetical protein [Planctomycetaceae bacterium]